MLALSRPSTTMGTAEERDADGWRIKVGGATAVAQGTAADPSADGGYVSCTTPTLAHGATRSEVSLHGAQYTSSALLTGGVHRIVDGNDELLGDASGGARLRRGERRDHGPPPARRLCVRVPRAAQPPGRRLPRRDRARLVRAVDARRALRRAAAGEWRQRPRCNQGQPRRRRDLQLQRSGERGCRRLLLPRASDARHRPRQPACADRVVADGRRGGGGRHLPRRRRSLLRRVPLWRDGGACDA